MMMSSLPSLPPTTPPGATSTNRSSQNVAAHEDANAEATPEISTLHREKDNFYKYKTAEQVTKHLARFSMHAAYAPSQMYHFTGDTNNNTNNNSSSHNSQQQQQQNHSLQQQNNTLQQQNNTLQQQSNTLQQHNHNLQQQSNTLQQHNHNLQQQNKTLQQQNSLQQHILQQQNSLQQHHHYHTNDTMSKSSTKDSQDSPPSSIPIGVVSHTRKRYSSASSSSKRGSIDTLSGCSSSSLRRSSPSVTSLGQPVRRVSFKTHAHSYQHRYRGARDKEAGAATGLGGGPGVSKVAKLTQKFNEIIQKDDKLLQEVRRNKGVLMARGGHVYKVIPAPQIAEKVAKPAAREPATEAAGPGSLYSTVQKNIRKFEKVGKKPLVPEKSQLVLRMQRDLAAAVMAKRHEKRSSSVSSDGGGGGGEDPPSHSGHLPMVQEEPLKGGGEEPAAPEACCLVASNAAGDEAERNVPPAESAESTYSRISAAIGVTAAYQTEAQVEQPSAAATSKQADNGDQQQLAAVADKTATGEDESPPPKKSKDRRSKYALIYEKLRRKPRGESAKSKGSQTAAEESEQPRKATSSAPATARTPEKAISKVTGTTNDSVTATTNQPQATSNTNHSQTTTHEPQTTTHEPQTTTHQPQTTTHHPQTITHQAQTTTHQPQTTSSTHELQTTSPTEQPRATSKLWDALDAVDKRLKDLNEDSPTIQPVMVLQRNEDFEKRVLPNSSFVHHHANNSSPVCMVQAVNVALVNQLEGEQMIMEQKELQREKRCSTTSSVSTAEEAHELTVTTVQYEDYEFIEPRSELRGEPAATNSKTETRPPPVESFVFKLATTTTTTVATNASCPSPPETESLLLSPLDADNIYQTIMEAMASSKAKAPDPLDDYEPIAEPPTDIYHDYEICEVPPTVALAVPQAPVRNTNDELPELPKPKRRLPKSPMPGKRAPEPKSREPEMAQEPVAAATKPLDEDDDEQHYYADDENIYDTIKIGGSSHCYESMPAPAPGSSNESEGPSALKVAAGKKLETRHSDCSSIASACYESITQYRRHHSSRIYGGVAAVCPGHASSGGSTLTISSDHKTNSLYEDSLIAANQGHIAELHQQLQLNQLLHQQQHHHHHHHQQHQHYRQQQQQQLHLHPHQLAAEQVAEELKPPISPSTSETSDGWIDISDTEGMAGGDGGGGSGSHPAQQQPQFIVVRERSKWHRSPDWSKRVREGRLRKTKSGSDDDSDHLYETLPVGGNRRQADRVVRRASSNRKRCPNELWRPNGPPMPAFPEGPRRCPNPALPSPIYDHESDSFDTDSDEAEHEHSKSLYADSGVDVRRLPPPPPSSNSVYSLVRKMKKLITPGSKNKPPKNATKKPAAPLPDNMYENSEIFQQAELPAPVMVLPAITAAAPPPPTTNGSAEKASLANGETGLNTKSKTGRSIRSRLRKSLVGSPFDLKGQGGGNALTPARSTFYINGPAGYGGSAGDLDSGLSEKASSGDLPPPPPPPSSAKSAAMAQQQQTASAKDSAANGSKAGDGKFLTVMRKSKKDSASSANQQRRRTLMGIRPDMPPPPPPEDGVYKKGSNRREAMSTTSWYAECGVFKVASPDLHGDDASLKTLTGQNGGGSSSGTNGAISPSRTTSWYTESGLYQTSAVSVASSSGSSGVSTGNEGCAGDDMPHGLFTNEPLYQMYTAAKVEQSISRDMDEVSTDGYEDIEQTPVGPGPVTPSFDGSHHQKRTRPTALQLVEPKNGPSRTLWSELPEVRNSGILPSLSPRERSLQEAKFEIITSEASYLKSLNLLRSHYMRHPMFADPQMVKARDKEALFGNIVPVIECSERLLMQLEHCWQDDVRLAGMSERIYTTAEEQFHVYVTFCEQQGHMDRTLRSLKEARGLFAQNLELLEASPVCCGLNLHSFLMLPMQRITRLPLLIDAVFSKTSPYDADYESWKMTLAIMNKIVAQCNEAANRFEQAYEIDRISRQLQFPGHILPLAIAPVGVAEIGTKPRFLVKKGELTHLIWRGDDAKVTFGKKFSKVPIYAFLFSDLLVLTKQRSGQQQPLYTVFDYCSRNFLTISAGDELTQLPTKDINGNAGKNLILMTLLENHEKKTVELVLSCPSISEQQRWLQAIRPPEAENPGEKLYEQWDCPQVIVRHAYEAKDPDELNLELSDVVNVSRKLPDGWFYGERIRDGAMGWFPGDYTEEVKTAHVRARNLKLRHRLLTFTANFIDATQKRK